MIFLIKAEQAIKKVFGLLVIWDTNNGYVRSLYN